MTAQYEVFAIRYATASRRASENFIGGDPHDGPMPIDYFVWLIRSAERTILVDTGFGAAAAEKRGRRLLRTPMAGVATLGVEAATIKDVVITHLHYDHAGNLPQFPGARFHLQDREMGFATGRQMCHAHIRHAFEVEDVVAMVRNVFAERVRFHDGDAEIADGVSLHHVGGHTDGLQFVRVRTARGWLVLASDASHFYANYRERRPFPIVYHMGDMIAGWDRLAALAEGPEHIIPGHDPLVLSSYPTVGAADSGIVALHRPPHAR